MNSLMGWSEQHVYAVLTEENTDLPPLTLRPCCGASGPRCRKSGIVGGRRGYPDIAACRG